MARKKQLIIPIFLPFGGCPHQCVFCDQNGITGSSALPSMDEVKKTIDAHLSTWKGNGRREAAFYGGSFTALPKEDQARYLAVSYGYLEKGLIDGVRVSTRPDCVQDQTVGFLKGYGVDTIELGAQSMSDEVLRLSGRGHTSSQTELASRLIKSSSMRLGLQIMPGLPGDTVDTIISTAERVATLSPDFIRVYPTLVLKGTPLHRMYLSGSYRPWSLDEMVSICRGVMDIFREAGIPVIKMGLQPTRELEESLVCGPFHPSFRQLVEKGLPA
ncbi:MAG: radical SAM protein [Deltaproteobacteria bacterium]|nr:radical SAM protein [Deltaproteobacteria bacterium]